MKFLCSPLNSVPEFENHWARLYRPKLKLTLTVVH